MFIIFFLQYDSIKEIDFTKKIASKGNETKYLHPILLIPSQTYKYIEMNNSVEIFGYVAMILLVISFLPKKIYTIRAINFVACVLFVVYGILLGWKWPLIISNGLIACIQVYHLFKWKYMANKAS
jgi:hypothetical protein